MKTSPGLTIVVVVAAAFLLGQVVAEQWAGQPDKGATGMINTPTDREHLELATFGGGCFWCTESVFSQVRGVVSVASGYSGGQTVDPTYREVCTGTTGHAEVVQIRFDPNTISYEDLLRIHLSTHDPTTLNRQGADHGTQYRSIVLYHDDQQRAMAEKVIAELQAQLDDPVVTELKAYEVFYQAEPNHQDYYANNPGAPYCQLVIEPKLHKFRKLFAPLLR